MQADDLQENGEHTIPELSIRVFRPFTLMRRQDPYMSSIAFQNSGVPNSWWYR